jgi:hypothetical protein
LLGGGRGEPGADRVSLNIAGPLGRNAGRPILSDALGIADAPEDVMSAIEIMPARLSAEETEDLRRAIRSLTRTGFTARVARVLASNVEALGGTMPVSARKIVARISERALRAALRVALRTIDTKSTRKSPSKSSGRLHMAAAAASGAIGGAFGLAAIPIELPVSTTILLRSIAEIARDEGEDLSSPETALACIEVFALGGPSAPGEAGLESGYFAVRGALAMSVSESARFIAAHGLSGESAPVVVRFVSQIAARFGVVVSEKLAAQAAPIVGAVGGAAVNAAFADYFQTLARGHFVIRRLERAHGPEAVRFEFRRLLGEAAAA